MIFIEQSVLKVGGVVIKGVVKSIEISENAKIDEVENEKKTQKKQQPTGYEGAKITVEMLLEKTKSMSCEEQLERMQKLFKTSDQKKAKVLNIVNKHCAARGVSKVYFKSLSSKGAISESSMTVSLEFIEYNPSVIVIKKSSSSASGGSSKKNTTKKNSSKNSSGSSSSGAGLSKEYQSYVNTQRGKAPKIRSKTSSSPARDTANTTKGKRNAKKVVR